MSNNGKPGLSCEYLRLSTCEYELIIELYGAPNDL